MFPFVPLLAFTLTQWPSFVAPVYALDNGLAKTPPMGWNPYNVYSCNTNEAQYKTSAKNVVRLELDRAGYKYFNLDCGWQGTKRDSAGKFTWNATRIPGGVPSLASYVHGLGLKFGVYSDAGYFSCDVVGGKAGWLGSIGHEMTDADTFASWGADYLKYDNCYAVNSTDFVDFNPPIRLEPHFTTMRDALKAASRPIAYSICEWGVQNPATWAPVAGNAWRIAGDINASWSSIVRIIDALVPITKYAAPGAWNDLDLLEVGNKGLTTVEQQTHFAFWAAAKSPLFISTDITNPSNTTMSILTNPRLIAVNQDSLGKSITQRKRYANDHDVWAGPLADGSTVVIVINWEDKSRSLKFDFADVGFKSATLVDLWTGDSLGKYKASYTATVAAHGNLALKLTGAV